MLLLRFWCICFAASLKVVTHHTETDTFLLHTLSAVLLSPCLLSLIKIRVLCCCYCECTAIQLSKHFFQIRVVCSATKNCVVFAVFPFFLVEFGAVMRSRCQWENALSVQQSLTINRNHKVKKWSQPFIETWGKKERRRDVKQEQHHGYTHGRQRNSDWTEQHYIKMDIECIAHTWNVRQQLILFDSKIRCWGKIREIVRCNCVRINNTTAVTCQQQNHHIVPWTKRARVLQLAKLQSDVLEWEWK